MVRTTLGAEVETTVNVTGAESVEFIRSDIGGPIPDGSEASAVIRPPTGFLYELISIRLFAPNPGGTSSGTHELRVRTESKQIGILLGTASGDKRLFFNQNIWVDADDRQRPFNQAGQTTAVAGGRASETAGITVRYLNRSTVSQSSDITVRLWVRKIQVA